MSSVRHRNRRTNRSGLAIAGAALLASWGCGQSGSPDAGDGAGPAGSANALVTLGIAQEFENMNPLVSQMAASTYIFGLIGHPLVSIDEDWEYRCWLCVEIPTLDNGLAELFEEDGQRKVRANWEIRPGAAWGDGTELTARDVVLAWQIGASPNVSVGSKEAYDQIESIEIDPENPRKFAVTLEEARYDYYQRVPTPLPSHIEGPVWERTKDSKGAYEKQTTFATDPTNPGLYSGPYRIEEIKLGSHVSVVRNEHFYGEPAKIDRFIVKLIPNTQTLEANLLSGNIDIISELGMTFDQALAFEKRARTDSALQKFEARFRRGMVYEHIDLNLRNPRLADLRVRQALVYAIDREKLVQSLFEGRQQAALHNIHPLDPYYTDAVTRYPHDVDRAAALLDEAGWRLGADGYRSRNGERLEFELMTTAQDKTRELVEVFLQDQWKQVGVAIQIKNEPARVFFGETVRKGRYSGMAMFAWISSPDSPPRSTLHSSEIPTEANGYSGQNTGGWSDAVVDRALDLVRIEFDLAKRRELMATVQREYTEQVPVIPLYLRSQISVVPTRLENYRMTGHQFYSTLSAQHWSMSQ